MIMQRRLFSAITKRNFSKLFSGSHLCMKGCLCMGVRTMASKAISKNKKKETVFEVSRLGKPLETELSHQEKLIKEERLTPEEVLADFARLLNEHRVTLQDSTTTEVKLLMTPTEGVRYAVVFDVDLVAEAVNQSYAAEDMEEMDQEEEEETPKRRSRKEIEEEQDEEEEFDEDEYDPYEQGEATPYQVKLEVERDSHPGRTLVFEAEVTPTNANYEELNEDAIEPFYLSNVHIRNAEREKGAYEGPSFVQLDEQLQNQMETFASKTIEPLLPLIQAYSKAKEASLYRDWLRQAKEIATGN